MAKALFGHVGSGDVRAADTVRRLHRRVRDLEDEVVRLRAENDALSAAVRDIGDVDLVTLEPVHEREVVLT